MRKPVSRNNEARFYHYKVHNKLNRQQFLYGIISLFDVKRLQKQ